MHKNILLIQLRQLGDILLTTPCIREIKRENPKATVTFLSHPMGRLVLEGNPYLDEFFTYQPGSWLKEWELSQRLRQRKFDVVIDFMNNPRSGFYSRRTNAPERIAFQSKRGWLYTRQIAKPAAAKYIVEEKFDLLRAAGYKPKDQKLVLPWSEYHAGPMLKFFADKMSSQRPRFVLSPTHRRTERQWPLLRYAALADRLVNDFNADVTWLWGPGEETVVAGAMALCNVSTRKAPATSFREMAALVANHDCFIGNSNGPSHVAVAVDIPSLQIHGPTNVTSWCPKTARHRGLGSARRKTHPAEAIQDVSLEQVCNEIHAMMPIISESVQRRLVIAGTPD